MLCFFHDMFTGSEATDYRKGGMLEIPYFWHWVTPNPRHEILTLPDSIELTKMKPPEKFSRYKTFADIDRTPSLYFSDLVSPDANYYHPQCGAFATFGWCSEREMAFTLLMSFYGYQGKIYQSSIHTWSEFWVELVDIDQTYKRFSVSVDNTFDIMEWKPLRLNIEISDWIADIGQGEKIRWYNAVAHSEDEKKQVEEIQVTEKAALRIQNLIEKYIGKE